MNNIFTQLIQMLSTIPVAGARDVNTMKSVFDILRALEQKMNEPEVDDNGEQGDR